MKVCTRDDAAPLSASAAREMSRSLARASEQTVLSLMIAAIALVYVRTVYRRVTL